MGGLSGESHRRWPLPAAGRQGPARLRWDHTRPWHSAGRAERQVETPGTSPQTACSGPLTWRSQSVVPGEMDQVKSVGEVRLSRCE